MSKKLLVPLLVVAAALLMLTGAAAAMLVTSDDDDNTTTSTPVEDTDKGHLGLTVTFSAADGLRVATVEPNGPAAIAGIQVGDVIMAIDGNVVRTPEDLREEIESRSPDTTVTVLYERGDRILEATAKLGEAPANAQIESTPPATSPTPQAGGQGQNANRAALGVQVQQITPALRQQYNLTRDTGLVVTNVQPGSAAEAAGIQRGDIILSVANQNVRTDEDIRRILTGRTGNVLVGILRGSEERSIDVSLQASLNQPNLNIPGIERLPRELRERIEQALQNGVLTPEQRLQIEDYIRSFQGGLRFGTIDTVESDAFVLENPLGGEQRFTVDAETEIKLAGQTVPLSQLQAGMTALVVTSDGMHATGIVAYPDR